MIRIVSVARPAVSSEAVRGINGGTFFLHSSVSFTVQTVIRFTLKHLEQHNAKVDRLCALLRILTIHVPRMSTMTADNLLLLARFTKS